MKMRRLGTVGLTMRMPEIAVSRGDPGLEIGWKSIQTAMLLVLRLTQWQ